MVERPPAALVGRDESLGVLRAALQRAAQGTPTLTLVTGETGVGKTRLVQEVVRAEGPALLYGASVPMAGDPLPFAPLTQGLRRLGDTGVVRQQLDRSPALARLVPGLRPTRDLPDQPEAHSQLELFQAVLELLGRLGGAEPALLVVEDIHWADRSTLDLLRFLATNVTAERAALVATYRDDAVVPGSPLASWLAEVTRLDVTTRLRLDRLDEADTAELVTALTGGAAEPEVLASTTARSAGNPLFIEHLVLQGSTDGPLPDTLRELLAARVAALPEPTRAVLKGAAVLGRGVRLEVLAATVGVSVEAAEAACRPALDQHVLELRAADRVGFRHPAFGEVVYAALLPSERARLHRAAALALEDETARAADGLGARDATDTYAAELARHWLRAGDVTRALDAAVVGGHAAERMFAFADAHVEYARAAELAGQVESDHDRSWLLSRAADCASLVGDSAEAVRLGEEALAVTDDPGARAELCERLGSFQYLAGRGDESERWYLQALDLLPAGDESVLAARVYAGLGLFGAAWARLDDAQTWSEAALRIARVTGARREEGRAQNAMGVIAASRGDVDAGTTHLRAALDLARDLGEPHDLATAYINLSHVLGLAGRYDEVVELCTEGDASLTRVGLSRQAGSLLRANACDALINAGRLDEAGELVAQTLALHPRGIMAAQVLRHASRLDLLAGRLDDAWERCEQARLILDSEGAPDAWKREVMEAAVAIELWAGRPAAAYELVIDGLHFVSGTDERAFAAPLVTLGWRALADQAEGHRDADSRGRLARQAEALVEATRWCGGTSPQDAAHRLWQTAERARLELRSDPTLWTRTAEAWTGLGQRFPAAYARWREAEARLDQAADAAANDTLRAARSAAQDLGAVMLVAEIDRLAGWHRIDLAAAGSSPVAPHPEGEGGTPAALAAYGLTDREVEVLGRLAAGRTNGEIARELFISAKTASVHVSNILRKLDVSGRQEAARVAHRLGIDG